jgi:hypothetical protein
MAYLPTRDSSNMTNGMYVAQKIITKAIFFTEHETIFNEGMIDGRTGLFVLAGIFLILGPIEDCSHSEFAGAAGLLLTPVRSEFFFAADSLNKCRSFGGGCL